MMIVMVIHLSISFFYFMQMEFNVIRNYYLYEQNIFPEILQWFAKSPFLLLQSVSYNGH